MPLEIGARPAIQIQALRFVPYRPRSIRCRCSAARLRHRHHEERSRRDRRRVTSLSWADEIIVVDSESTDDTVAIARQFTDRVYVRPWPGYVDQKNHAAAPRDPRLDFFARRRRAGARRASRGDPGAASIGAHDARISACRACPFISGRWMRTTDMYPDYQLRLYDRRSARWDGLHVHESVKVETGVVGYLEERDAALPLQGSLRAPDPHGSIHDARGQADVRERQARDTARAALPPAHRVCCATTSSRAAFATAKPGSSSRS